MNDKNTLEYWEKNISGFAGFYNKNSEEALRGNKLLTYFYKKFLLPIEKKYMMKRYDLVLSFIQKNSQSDKTWADIGCGSGVFTSILAHHNHKVFALDFADSALKLTQKSVDVNQCKNVELMKLDIFKDSIPPADFAIAIGVAPYIKDIAVFLKHILPYTNKLYFNILDAKHPLNKLRNHVTLLDVRGYYYHSCDEIESIAKTYHFNLTEQTKLATGWMLELSKINSLIN